MDAGGSFLDQACVRIAVLRTGCSMSDERFDELASYLTSLREVALNVLPRRATHTRSFSTSAAGNTSYLHPPSDPRNSSERFSDSGSFSGTRFLSRTFSASRDSPKLPAESLSPTSAAATESPKSISGSPSTSSLSTGNPGTVPPLPLHSRRSSTARRSRARAVSLHNSSDLNLEHEDVDSLFRLRYDIIHRNHSGDLILRTPSQWDSFHSRRVWGVIGIVDCTDPELYDNQEERDRILREAQDDFMAALKSFPSSYVSRVIVFTTPDAAKQTGASVMNSPSVGGRPLSVPSEPTGELVFGYVPESTKYHETLLELKVQIVHFSGLLLNSLDRECWKIERSSNELFLSPLDEPSTPDNQSKLMKRRPGRQDKLLADTHLMMGSPAEALAKYNSAIEKAKANSDRLWLAGAMEGWSAAHVFSYVKGGGAVRDQALSNKLIEHYAEIYKLYQKKRIPELESLAALRLAEFLGRFTTRRKDALEAAGHAAVVGESLSSAKRAALWESLARFSEFMKCYRKAAFYLYRVGSLCASKAVWPSSEALLTASGKQFKRGNGKIWPDLHRDILMEAGKSAWETGDAFLATQHYVEALALSSSTLHRNTKGDANLVKLLVETTTPAYLPSASKLLHLQGCRALQIPSLVVKENALVENEIGNARSSHNGPFIYNPFEAKAREKAAAAASRAVTWVCGEAAQVSLRIQNRTHTDLPVEIIAIAIVDSNRAIEVWPVDDKKQWSSAKGKAEGEQGGQGGQGGEEKSVVFSEEDPQVTYARRVKGVLRIVTGTVETLSETVTLPPMHSSQFVEKTISVFPRKTGAMRICGLIARLFRGTIVLLSTPDALKGDSSAPPINVIKELPRLDVSIRQEDGEFSAFNLDKQPATIFEGERRRFSVRVKNVGKDDVSNPTIQVTSSNPSLIQISEIGSRLSRIEKANLRIGLACEFVVEVTGNRVLSTEKSLSGGILNVAVIYTGKTDKSMMRESRAVVPLIVRPAIRIGSFSTFMLPAQNDVKGEEIDHRESRYGLILDVENLVSMPVLIALPPSWRSPDILSTPEAGSFGMFNLNSPCPAVNVLECGASTRLITVIPNDFFAEDSDGQERQGSCLTLAWAMPGIARNGTAEVRKEDILKTRSFFNFSYPLDSAINSFSHAGNALIEIHTTAHQRSMNYYPGGNAEAAELTGVDKSGTRACSLNTRKYYTSTVVVSNQGTGPFPINTVLDLCVLQNDGRGGARLVQGATLVGAVECVRVGPLAPGESFEQSFKMRFTSVGIFELNGFVHEWDGETVTSLDAILVEVNTRQMHPQKSRWANANKKSSVEVGSQERAKSASPPKANGLDMVRRAHSVQTVAKEEQTQETATEKATRHKRAKSLFTSEGEKSPVETSAGEKFADKNVARSLDHEGSRDRLLQLQLGRVLGRCATTVYVTPDKWDRENSGRTQSGFGPHLGHAGSSGSRLSIDRIQKPEPDKLF